MREPSGEKINDLHTALSTAEKILMREFGHPIHLQLVKKFTVGARGNIVARCSVDDAPLGQPSHVIVKQTQIDAYEPNTPSLSAWGLFNEWAGTQFLNAHWSDSLFGPRFFGGDRDAGVIVSEDLGDGKSVLDVLSNSDSATACKVLCVYSAQLGRMHGQTTGHARDWAKIRGSLGAIRHPTYAGKALAIRHSRSKLQAVLSTIDVSFDRQFELDMQSIANSLEAPGPFFAFVHGDPCLDNCIQSVGSVRFFDFEFSRYQLALFDWVYALMIFPSCWTANRLPQDVLSQMEMTYRTELAKWCPEAEDDKRYGQALVDACGAWAITILYRYLERALTDTDKSNVLNDRQRIIARFDTFVGISEKYGHLKAVRETVFRVEETLMRRWKISPNDLAFYKAFQHGK